MLTDPFRPERSDEIQKIADFASAEILNWISAEIQKGSEFTSNKHVEIRPIPDRPEAIGNIYIRYSTRYFRREKIRCLDLASINIIPEYQSRGLASGILTRLEKDCPIPIYVECILHQKFGRYLLRRGYFRIDDNIDVPYNLIFHKI